MVVELEFRRSGKITQAALGKPRGIIQDRARNVGPERSGIVAVDCANVRSKWMLREFRGKAPVPRTF